MSPIGRATWAGAVITAIAVPALAFNPGTSSRAADTSSLTNTVQICEGGANDGGTCSFDVDCQGPPAGTCTGIQNVTAAARGTLTIIADTLLRTAQAGESNWDEDDTPAPTCSNPAPGSPNDCEGIATSTLTLVVEFVRNGESYIVAETFTDLFDPQSLFPGFVVQPAGYGGWVQTSGESNIAESSAVAGTDTVRIRWGILPPAAEAKVLSILGGVAGQRVVLAQVNDVPICTDATECNHGGANTGYADHSGGTDVLATVRRFKVDIALMGP